MDNELENKQGEAPADAPSTEPTPSIDVTKLIEALKAKGLTDEQIIPALEKAAQDGKLSTEDLAKAKELLNSANDEQEAEKMFGMKFVK